MEFLSSVTPPTDTGWPALWFAFCGDKLLVETAGDRVTIPRMADPAERSLNTVRTQYLGTLNGEPCYSAELNGVPDPPAGMSFSPLRPLLGVLEEYLFTLAGRAFQVMDWDRAHQYCGKCGRRTEQLSGERARICTGCGMHFFPRVTPAVIVAVVRDRKILLAQSRRFPSVFYSVLAGFVEPGETFEECVRREVREEVGIEVANLRYFGSQPWPFPHSLMVAFTAEYAGGELVLEEKEIVHAAWFDAGGVARLQIPRRGTIARQLIDRFLGRGAP